MIKFHFEDKSIELPTRWSEVTVEHFINPDFLSGDSIRLLAALANVPPSKLANTTEDLTKHFDKTTAFMKRNPMGWKGERKEQEIELFGNTYKVPENIEMRMFGQKVMLGQAMVAAGHVYSSIPNAIAIYFGPMVFPEDWFEQERQRELREEVLKLPIGKVFSIADFFLQTSEGYRKSGAKS